MSLLMDALKKAEREREAQASKKRGEDRAAASEELSLDPIEDSRAEDAAGDTEDSKADWDASEAGADDLSRGFDVDAADFELETQTGLGAPGKEVPLPPARGKDAAFSPRESAPMSLEDTSSTMPSMKAVKASVDRYFDGGQSGALSLEESRDPGDATTVVQHRTTPEIQTAAQTVFDAKQLRRRRGGLWVWAAVLPVLLLVLLGGAYYYWFNISGGRWGPVVSEVGGVPGEPTLVPGARTEAPAAVASTGSGTLASGAGATGDAAPVTGFGPAESEAEPPPVGELTLGPEPEEIVAPMPAEPAPMAPQSTEALLASADAQISEALGALPMMEPGAIRSSGVKLSRRSVSRQVSPRVMSAYNAFLAGDLPSAERDYRVALAAEPNNRDALLGLAAIAVRKQRWPVAAEIYRQLLRLDPRDSVAQSALIALQGNLDPSEGESRLKLMIEREPDADYLHFSLGNLYASQARWADAQNAYFSAYRLDSDNPDYAYNLAVGLDHLSKSRAALEYYQLALQLAGSQRAGFEHGAVTRRIQSITGSASTQ